MIIREPDMADKAAFILAMQRSQALHSACVVSPQTEEKFDKYIQRSQKANQTCFLSCIVNASNLSVKKDEILISKFLRCCANNKRVIVTSPIYYLSAELNLRFSTTLRTNVLSFAAPCVDLEPVPEN